jgi:CheY-like chemotaxis protein
VEDDPITNYINKRLINIVNSTINVHFALNGREGLSFIQKSHKENKNIPQLILLDINMPVMNGFEFL